MMLTEFVKHWDGEYITVTGLDSGQCTAVAHAWVKNLGLPIVYGHAKDTYANAGAYPQHYDQTINRPDNFPLPGAIVVFKATNGNPYGHTVLNIEADKNRLRVLSQNDPLGSPARIKTYSYDLVLGWFTPKVNLGDLPMTDEQEKEAYRLVLGREREGGPTGRTALQFIIDARVELDIQRKNQTELADSLRTQILSQQTTIGGQVEQIGELGKQLEAARKAQPLPPQTLPLSESDTSVPSESPSQPQSQEPSSIPNNANKDNRPAMSNIGKFAKWLDGNKTILGIVAGAVYSVLIALNLVPSDDLAWTAIATWTGISFRLALKK